MVIAEDLLAFDLLTTADLACYKRVKDF